jgi:alpha-galactosidase
VLLTRHTALALALDEHGFLHVVHWGASGRSTRLDDYLPPAARSGQIAAGMLDGRPLAFPVYGDPTYKEPCLALSRDGHRESRFEFAEDQVLETERGPLLELSFRDRLLQSRLILRFRLYAEHDVIGRSASVVNDGEAPLTIERMLSAALPLPPGAYEAWTLHGRWGGEFQLQRRPLAPGKLVVDSRRGLSSHEAHPWFALSPCGETGEQRGPVWFGSLAWSGNWTAVFEVERNQALTVSAGLQPFEFAWRLEPGERFDAPELVCGYTEDGLGGASRLLHAYEAAVALPAGQAGTLRPVLYNSWEATGFDVHVEPQIELARRASELGVELFVVDDGWFGARDSDRAGLGDWLVNPRKFPRGLRQLIDEVERLGMAFGIWVEPEMVNPDSDLYRAHPDWAFQAVGRESTLGRNQLVLNFARADVREHILDRLRALLTEHGRIAFLKWDHNRSWSEVGWSERPERAREAWVRHVLGLYAVLARLRQEFPELLIETCAGGGGRADLGMLKLSDQAWVSDNTDAADRLGIQYGYSHAHSPRTMVNWVTDVPNQQTGRTTPLAFRFHVAMQGVLGIGGDIGRWSDADLHAAKQLVATYKTIRPTVQQGRQFWLAGPGELGPCAVQYVSPAQDETVLLLYELRGRVGEGVRRVRLQGLEPQSRYRRRSDGAESTGAALMAAGVPALFSADDRPWALDWRSEIQVWRATG